MLNRAILASSDPRIDWCAKLKIHDFLFSNLKADTGNAVSARCHEALQISEQQIVVLFDEGVHVIRHVSSIVDETELLENIFFFELI